MTHELKKIVQAYILAKHAKLKTVMATVVALDGSSYRRPGVRMLIHENGITIGAVSGGCVEKEVIHQAQSVFKDGVPKVMTYDGRYRLGCEGILYVLIEPFEPNDIFLNAFHKLLEQRIPIKIEAYFAMQDISNTSFGSVFTLGTTKYLIRDAFDLDKSLKVFGQELAPCFKLLIIGAEHDAVQLCSFASMTGWEVTIVSSPTEEKTISDFPGALNLKGIEPDEMDISTIDQQTAVVLMTHSYVKDLKFLLRLVGTGPAYLGILGPVKRREKLLGELIERQPELNDTFLDGIYGPAGLNIGAETPQEIAIAILSEILAVVRDQDPIMLRNKTNSIHS